MHLEEENFFRSTLKKVMYLIEKWAGEEKMKAAALSGAAGNHGNIPNNLPDPQRPARSVKEVMSYYGN